eukprot:CAMPEP_0173409092 /NCGR_PEP_ID=MMETSP1356-20130122/71368_1 /TAXON_ID=77927 ORGANISM="Hemiselmis virescens, Strain PCC157" /NCGR_SAMPLE_ID=MMETSP1356 /ASSEMBLY_ACC=CAM_ASM_000847 /LENGTH=95 /DNA_ID=CAMNT_0014370507 /DNA_START=10 /DNA_END=297 /DNA_ORIENTATION=+
MGANSNEWMSMREAAKYSSSEGNQLRKRQSVFDGLCLLGTREEDEDHLTSEGEGDHRLFALLSCVDRAPLRNATERSASGGAAAEEEAMEGRAAM